MNKTQRAWLTCDPPAILPAGRCCREGKNTMHFLAGLAIVLGIIYGMIVSPPFRVASLIVIGASAMLLWMAPGDPFG